MGLEAKEGSVETRPCSAHAAADTLEQIACTKCGAFKAHKNAKLEYFQVAKSSVELPDVWRKRGIL